MRLPVPYTSISAVCVLHSFPTRRSSDLMVLDLKLPDMTGFELIEKLQKDLGRPDLPIIVYTGKELTRSEEHTSELQSHLNLVCRLLLEKKKKMPHYTNDSL